MFDPILRMFNNIEYAVELNSATWVDHMERGCRALENFFPANPLTWNSDKHSLIKNRHKYLLSRLKGKRWTFGLSNGLPQNQMNIQETGYARVCGQTYLGEVIYRMRAAIPATTVEMGETVFVALGDAVQAHWSQVKPYKACNQLRGYKYVLLGLTEEERANKFTDPRILQGEHLHSELAKLGLSLPLIDHGSRTPHLHPAQPFELGWLNYWSAETCEYLGFPDPERDRDLLEHSYQTPGGAWLVKICPDPLDLDRPDHLRIFAEIYRRFPKLGLREAKVEPPPPFRYPEHTSYLHHGDPGHIAERLVRLLEAHGYRSTEGPASEAETGGVIFGLIPGAANWTIVKTRPEEFLADPLPGQPEPLLARLCRDLRRGGFSLNVYSELEAALLEVAGTGRVSRSGIRSFAELPEDVDFEAMEEGGHPPLLQFRWLNPGVETGVGDFDDYGQIAHQVHELLAGKNADLCSDQAFAEALDGPSLQDRQGVRLCFIPGAS